MTNFGHKIMLTVLVLLITPPLGAVLAKAESSLNLSNTFELNEVQKRIAKVKTTFCLCENST